MASASEGTALDDRQRKRGMLQSYYQPGYGSQDASMELATASAVDQDLDAPGFDPATYLNQLLREKSLTQLMDKEEEMTKSIRSLDSSMQTLVYENYNKFIDATDTIRKMKNDFKKMEDEMDCLAKNMEQITAFSSQISDTLHENREQITTLYGVHSLLQKLQFLFELPLRMKTCIEKGEYDVAVRHHVDASRVIERYKDTPSFKGIQVDCALMVEELKDELKLRFRDRECTPQQLSECVDLLLQLGLPPEELYEEYLSHAREKLREDIKYLEEQVTLRHAQSKLSASGRDSGGDTGSPAGAPLSDAAADVLEFVDMGCNRFLSNMCLVIASYTDMFLNKLADSGSSDMVAVKTLINFVHELMDAYFALIDRRLSLEDRRCDTKLLVRALDRFHRRLQAMNKLLPNTDFARAGNEIVLRATKERIAQYLLSLNEHFTGTLTDIRQSLAAPRAAAAAATGQPAAGRPEPGSGAGPSPALAPLLHDFNVAVVDRVKSTLTSLQPFLETIVTFSAKSYFRSTFCTEVREKLMLGHLRRILEIASEYCEAPGGNASSAASAAGAPPLLLILARFCSDMGASTVPYLVSHADELFSLEGGQVTSATAPLCDSFKKLAQKLLNHYVQSQGQILSQLVRKSVETRDWLNTIEPRNVRAVMKRVIEDVTAIDAAVGQLFEEGARKDRSSDSSRRTLAFSSASAAAASARQPSRAAWTYAASLNSTLMSNIHKLFSEKIEIFTVIEFSKVSILMGIVKITLKTFLEAVRLRTFSRYGLQQIQVDTHYLQLYLWRFVSDENIVHSLLDEIVGSAVHRCVNPVLMEPSVVELICEQG